MEMTLRAIIGDIVGDLIDFLPDGGGEEEAEAPLAGEGAGHTGSLE